ncbi:MAG: FeoB-associated Cys-rich membrane protein [Oscillospiraceae bacterium]|nr:FeoB-associated Cys-rich membrane protein [Oscillospiraceae bacterium]
MLGTIFVCLILAAVVALIIRGQVRSKKQGKSSCTCGCANCSLHGECHKK